MSKKGRKIEEREKNKKEGNLTRQQGMNDCCADNYLAYFFFKRTFLYFNTVECHKTMFLG